MATAKQSKTVPVDLETTRKRTLVLNIPPSLWKPPTASVVIDGETYAPKDELHVTLLGRALLEEIETQLSLRLRRRLWAEARNRQWRIDRGGDLHLLEHFDPATPGAPSARSIVEMIMLDGAEAFYQSLEHQVGRQLPRPPTHVTLYTLRDAGGIGIPDAGSLRRLTVRTLTREELASA